jgi:hypothetical protein
MPGVPLLLSVLIVYAAAGLAFMVGIHVLRRRYEHRPSSVNLPAHLRSQLRTERGRGRPPWGRPANTDRRLTRAEKRAWKSLERRLVRALAESAGREAAELTAMFAGARVYSIGLLDREAPGVRPSPRLRPPTRVEVVTDLGALRLAVSREADAHLLVQSIKGCDTVLDQVLLDRECGWRVRFRSGQFMIAVPAVDVQRLRA